MTRRRDDDDRIVRDGEAVRVPLVMMDSTQRAVVADARRRVVVRDPLGRVTGYAEEEEQADAAFSDAALALHRPGYRYTTDATVNDDAAVEAYRRYVADQRNAWSKRDAPPPPGACPRSAGKGNPCTINGAPGVLVESDDGQSLVCKPVSRADAAPAGPVFDVVEGQRIKDAAWRQMVDEQREAWRKR
jgi:hypothetical protein